MGRSRLGDGGGARAWLLAEGPAAARSRQVLARYQRPGGGFPSFGDALHAAVKDAVAQDAEETWASRLSLSTASTARARGWP